MLLGSPIPESPPLTPHRRTSALYDLMLSKIDQYSPSRSFIPANDSSYIDNKIAGRSSPTPYCYYTIGSGKGMRVFWNGFDRMYMATAVQLTNMVLLDIPPWFKQHLPIMPVEGEMYVIHLSIIKAIY